MASQFNARKPGPCAHLGKTAQPPVRLHVNCMYSTLPTRNSCIAGPGHASDKAPAQHVAYPNAKRAAELHAIHVPRSRVASRAKDYVDVIEDMMPHRHDVDELASALGKGVLGATVEVRPRRPADPLFTAIHTGFGTGCQDVVSLACRTAPSGST
jgi:hypothetical protein